MPRRMYLMLCRVLFSFGIGILFYSFSYRPNNPNYPSFTKSTNSDSVNPFYNSSSCPSDKKHPSLQRTRSILIYLELYHFLPSQPNTYLAYYHFRFATSRHSEGYAFLIVRLSPNIQKDTTSLSCKHKADCVFSFQ